MKKVVCTALMTLVCLFANAQTVITLIASNNNEGDYTIFSSSGATTLAGIDKPIIIAEGFDIQNNISGLSIGNGLSEQKNNFLGLQLLNAGFDVIILNFKDPYDNLEDNAQLLVKLIELTNQQKQGSHKLIVGGISMGGLIARYALTWMEANNKDHNTSLYMSIDAPHKGANIPVALQWVINDISSVAPFPNIMELKAIFSKNSAKQMIAVTPPNFQPDNMFTAFFTSLHNLNNFGYPKNCKRIAIANGSRNGTTNTYAGLINAWAFNNTGMSGNMSNLADITARAYMAPSYRTIPNITNGPMELGYTFLTFIIGQRLFTTSTLNTIEGHDYAPGGKNSSLCKGIIDEFKFFNTANDAEFSHADHFTFIPTVSALDVSTTNLFTNIQADDGILCNTPFHAFYAPLENQEHADVGAISSNWLFDQIISVSQNSPITIPSGESFNFGGATSHLITNNYRVEVGAVLAVNKNDFIDYKSKNSSTFNFSQVPYTNSTSSFTITMQTCGNPHTIDVATGGTVELGDGATRTGVLVIKNGNSLNLNGTLKINNGSKLIIDEGATLKFNQGCVIQLNGPNAVLEIKGNLLLMANTIFKTTGDGYVLFNMKNTQTAPHITATGTNCQMIFEDLNNSKQKRLEVAGNTNLVIPNNLNLLKVNYVRTELGFKAGIKIACATEIENCDFVRAASNPQPISHHGLTFFGQANVNIRQCNFYDAMTAITLLKVAGQKKINVLYSGFYDCYIAIKSNESGGYFRYNTFKNNTTIWADANPKGVTTFEHNLIADNKGGYFFMGGGSGSGVGFMGNMFRNNAGTLNPSGNVKTYLTCNQFFNNGQNGLFEGSSWLWATSNIKYQLKTNNGTVVPTGHNLFNTGYTPNPQYVPNYSPRTTQKGIEFNNTSHYNFNEGHNTFVNNHPSGSALNTQSIYGDLSRKPINLLGNSNDVLFNNNKWVPDIAPFNTGLNILTTNSATTPNKHLLLKFNANTSTPPYLYGIQKSTASTCPIPEWNKALGNPFDFSVNLSDPNVVYIGPGLFNDNMANNAGPGNVNEIGMVGVTPTIIEGGVYAGQNYKVGAEAALTATHNGGRNENGLIVNVEGLQALGALVQQTVALSSVEDRTIWDLLYTHYIEYTYEAKAAGAFDNNPTLVNQHIATTVDIIDAALIQNDLYLAIDTPSHYYKKLAFNYDKATIYNTFNQYEQGIPVLNNMYPFVQEKEKGGYDAIVCIAENEKLYKDSLITRLELEENISNCMVAYVDNQITMYGFSNDSIYIDSITPPIPPPTYTLQPNPVISSTTVNLTLTFDAEVQISVYNKFGVKVIQDIQLGSLLTGLHTQEVILSGLPTDIYNMVVFINGVPYVKHFVKLAE